jgi:hypothetical protein
MTQFYIYIKSYFYTQSSKFLHIYFLIDEHVFIQKDREPGWRLFFAAKIIIRYTHVHFILPKFPFGANYCQCSLFNTFNPRLEQTTFRFEQTTTSAHFSQKPSGRWEIFEEKLFLLTITTMFLQIFFLKICCQV